MNLKVLRPAAVAVAAMAFVLPAVAQSNNQEVEVPKRVVFVTGNANSLNSGVIEALYFNPEFPFQDPSCPRFLFVDRKGSIALGIGGYVRGSFSYDFDGAIDAVGFNTFDLPVPADPAQRSGMQWDAAHSTVFMQLAGHNSLVGTYYAYVQTNFTGGGNAHELKLKKAYVKVGNVTAGLTSSTFVDPSGPPTVDVEGPRGSSTGKSVILQYARSFGDGWRAALGVEQPVADYTLGAHASTIIQRVPDIPAYVQYGWGKSSHVRMSGVFRQLSYRDDVTERNRFATGWGVQLSGQAAIPGNLTLYYGGIFGHGIAHYIADTSGNDLDLIPSTSTQGELSAPGDLGITAGLQWNFSDKGFCSACYSLNRLYDVGYFGPTGYRRAEYIAANVFYNVFPDCRIGVEYIHGQRTNADLRHGTANRVMCAVQYNF